MNNSLFFESELQKCSTKRGTGINIIEEKKWKGEVLIPMAVTFRIMRLLLLVLAFPEFRGQTLNVFFFPPPYFFFCFQPQGTGSQTLALFTAAARPSVKEWRCKTRILRPIIVIIWSSRFIIKHKVNVGLMI